MKRSMFVVVVLMAAIAAYGSDKRVRAVDFNAQGLAGRVCLPGDPCGWPSVIQVPLNGPVCLPGDPCGPQPMKAEFRLGAFKLNGPVCLPGDPCGPGRKP